MNASQRYNVLYCNLLFYEKKRVIVYFIMHFLTRLSKQTVQSVCTVCTLLHSFIHNANKKACEPKDVNEQDTEKKSTAMNNSLCAEVKYSVINCDRGAIGGNAASSRWLMPFILLLNYFKWPANTNKNSKILRTFHRHF